METEMLFVDFKQALDSIKRNKSLKVLKNLAVDPKLPSLIQITIIGTTVSVSTQKDEAEEFEINKGVNHSRLNHFTD